MSISDDAFKAMANKVYQEEQEKAQHKSSGDFKYENIKWVGLTEGVPKIFRAVGELPQSFASPTTARTIRYAKIIDDKKKEMRVVLPTKETGDDHIIWRIIDRVSEVEWIEKKKFFIHERMNPAIYDMVCKNSKPKGTDAYKYDKGWAGRDMFLFNGIDRTPEVYAWSKENKHTVLLSKGISIVKQNDGTFREYPETGIPAFGFSNILAINVFKHYGDWNNYDLGIEKTGLKDNPYRIVNASKYIEEIPEGIRGHIVSGPLTEEELSWERYDFDKLYAVTSYTKLYNRLKKSIAMIDFALGTHYEEELKSLADEEAKTRKEQHDSDDADVEVPVASSKVVEAPVVSARAPRASAVVETKENEPIGLFRLSDANRACITSMKHIKDKHWEMEYKTTEKIIPCNICKTESPMDFLVCPGCNSDF